MAFSLMVTLIWLYNTLLKLIALLSRNQPPLVWAGQMSRSARICPLAIASACAAWSRSFKRA